MNRPALGDLSISLPMDAEREKLIGARLRAFRETLQIPRTKFAFTVACGSERFAAYEAGRARLPYEVFHYITGRYFLNPFWLAWGASGGSPRLDAPFDDTGFVQHVSGHALFSATFDASIATMFSELQRREMKEDEQLRQTVSRLKSKLLTKPELLDANLVKEIGALRMIAQQFETDLEFRKRAAGPGGKNDLTKVLTTSNMGAVKPLWPELKRRLQKATAETGKKSELAKFLKTGLTVVSRWLTDDKSAREPGAEYALQMLHWVEQQERQK
jgi:hypothetical protein